MKVCRHKKKLNIVLLIIMIIAISMLSISCVCPLFSLLERATGLNISTGNNIDAGLVEDELIYPDSLAVVQVKGDIEKVLELIGEYGAALSENELDVLDQLPDQIKQQEISSTVYSAADDKDKVLNYYNSLVARGWEISDFGDAGGNLDGSNILLAEKGDRKQALLLSKTSNNTFIIFIDFDWDTIEGMNE